MLYLLDTNIVSELAKPKPHLRVVQSFAEKQASIAIATITLHEIRFGIDRTPFSKRRDHLESFWQTVVVYIPNLPYSSEAAIWHAEERARLMAIGKPSAYADGQIAAIAVCNNLTLVTANTQDFAPFNRLQLENWFNA